MKYQRLNTAELESLKEDFIRFLASQGIDAEGWQRMKSENLDGAEEIIDIYSDLVYDQALSKCTYLEHVSAKEFKAIEFRDNEAWVQGIRVKPNSDINLNTDQFQQSVQEGLAQNEIDVFTAQKEFKNIREQEMFEWIKKGAYMTDDKWFKEISRLLDHMENK